MSESLYRPRRFQVGKPNAMSEGNQRAREAACYLMTCIFGAASQGGWTREQILELAKTCRARWPEFAPGGRSGSENPTA